jgi:hypothetical protein
MPVHDWTRVSADVFHDFQMSWSSHVSESLNARYLPRDFYSLTASQESSYASPSAHCLSALSATTRLKTRRVSAVASLRRKRRTVVIRHVSGHRIVAMIEIASPANKDRASSVEQLVGKIRDAVTQGIHVLLVDLLPPGKFDPHGLHGEFWQEFGPESASQPLNRPLCLASYEAIDPPEAFLDLISIGDALPDMPLFYESGLYVNVPLEVTYQQTWRGVPEFWRDVIEGRRTAES